MNYQDEEYLLGHDVDSKLRGEEERPFLWAQYERAIEKMDSDYPPSFHTWLHELS